MTFNIHGGVGCDGVYDLERIAAVIRDAQPDYVALQEVHSRTAVAPEDQAAALAQRTAMHAYFQPMLRGTPQDRDGQGEYGNAILTRAPIAQTKACALRTACAAPEPRGACAVRTVDAPFWFGCTHLGCDWWGAEQGASVAPIEAFVASLGAETVVMAGDLNSLPCMRAPRTLVGTHGWTDAWRAAGSTGYFAGCTFPASWPNKRIDYVLVRGPRLVPRDATVVRLDAPYASDHRPVVVTFEERAP